MCVWHMVVCGVVGMVLVAASMHAIQVDRELWCVSGWWSGCGVWGVLMRQSVLCGVGGTTDQSNGRYGGDGVRHAKRTAMRQVT